jgi:hypothetical protein
VATRWIPITPWCDLCCTHQFVMLQEVSESTQPLVLAAACHSCHGLHFKFTRLFYTALRCDSCNTHLFGMLLHLSEFNQPLILAITAAVISFSITAVFHTASVIRTRCPYSSCLPSQFILHSHLVYMFISRIHFSRSVQVISDSSSIR